MKNKVFLIVTIIMVLIMTQFSILIGEVNADVVNGAFKDVSFSLDLQTGTLTISGIGTIIGEINGLGNSWKNWMHLEISENDVKNVIIQNGITSIGDYAFKDFGSITSIKIPNSVTSIGKDAFYGCCSLKSIEIPDSVIDMGDYVFYRCTSLTSMKIPEGVTNIGDYAFRDCDRLTSIEIPNTVTSIGDSAFYSCNSLKNINIPESVTSIGEAVFSNCENLISIEIPEGVTYIGDNAFVSTNSNLKIYGKEGSYAQEYANKNGIKFVVGKDNEITKEKMIIEDNLIYTGKVVKPQIQVFVGGKLLNENVDYTITYYDESINAGKYDIKIQGKGDYKGNVIFSYDIMKAETKFDFACSDTYEGIQLRPVVTENNTPYTPIFEYRKLGSDSFTTEVPKEVGTYIVRGYIDGANYIYSSIEKTVEIKKSDIPFKDVIPSSWYFNAVKYVYDNKIVSGYNETTFAPDDKLTRGMLVTILYRIEGSPNNDGKSKFTDVDPDEYYAKAVKWAVNAGIVNGYNNSDKFGPKDNVLRQDLAGMLRNYAKYKKKNVSVTTDLSKYSDYKKIETYAIDSMKWAVGSGVITGNANGTLAPKGNATRAEAAAMIQKYCQKVGR